MTWQPRAESAARTMRTRIAASALTMLGVLVSLISLLATSWYTISGPNVFSRPEQMPANKGAVVLLVDPHVGAHHSWLVWLVFGCCVAAAVVAGLPTANLPLVGRIACSILAAVLIVLAVARVAVTRLALGNVVDVPPGTSVDVHFGFWLALVGFALLGVGAALRPLWAPAGQFVHGGARPPL